MSLYERISKIATKVPGKTAFVFEGREILYSEFYEDINNLIDYLLRLGVTKGDRISWLGLNHYKAIEIFFACAGVGAIFVPINWRLSHVEIEKVLQDCEPTLVFYANQKVPAKLNYDPSIFVDALAQDLWVDSKKNHNYQMDVDLKSEVLISYTSGSTGEPKGVVINQETIFSNANMSVEAHSLNENDVVLNVLPIFHVGGLNILVTPALLLGATVLLHAKFDIEKMMEDLSKSTCVIFVPTILKEIISDPRFISKSLNSIKTLSIGSTIVPLDLIKQILALGVKIIQLYGSTEVTPFAIHQRIKDVESSVGSIGKEGADCLIKLIDESGTEVVEGEVGEICVKGKNIFSRYYGKNEEIFNNGWFRTGDLAYKDERGNYWFADRIRNVIISGGENIYPAEIENIALINSDFSIAAAVGKIDPKWGEVPVLFIEGKEVPNSNLLEHEAWDALASYKRPREIKFLRMFPKNTMGKIKLDELRAIANGKVSAD
ncbi:MAG: class I adenylate-forming enzyme family protein [Paracoccaceae bacterium]